MLSRAEGEYMSQPDRVTRVLLWAGAVAGLQMSAVSGVLGATRVGFDFKRHANSQLVLGEKGWIQTLNFITYGVLVAAFGVGVGRVTRPSRAGRTAAAGVVTYGLLAGVVVGLNPTEPQFGFPPGTRAGYVGYRELGLRARIHGIAGGVGFSAIIVACFALFAYFAGYRRWAWAVLSAVVGASVAAVGATLGANASTEVDSFDFRPSWIAGGALWLYISAVARKLARSAAH